MSSNPQIITIIALCMIYSMQTVFRRAPKNVYIITSENIHNNEHICVELEMAAAHWLAGGGKSCQRRFLRADWLMGIRFGGL